MSYEEEDTCAGGLLHAFREEEDTCHMRRRIHVQGDSCMPFVSHLRRRIHVI
jgi:hypothetical protein